MKSLFGICSAAAVIGAVLIPTAASAAVTAPAYSAPPGGDTTVTFAVTGDDLTLTAPGSVDLGSGLQGDPPFGGNIGDTTVTDNRAALAASWTVTVSETDFVTGGGTGPEIIPANAVFYDPTIEVSTGNFTSLSANSVTLDNGAQPVVNASVEGDNTATWATTLTVTIPPTAITGTYTGTLMQSVT